MKNILIPTNFDATSIRLATQVVQSLNEKVNVVFFHAFEPAYYFTDLYRQENPINSLITDAHRQSCKQFKERYAELVGSVNFLSMRGNTTSLFRNFMEANQIDMIACPNGYAFVKVHKDSINPLSFFKRSRLPLLQQLIQPREVVITNAVLETVTLAS